MANTPIKDRTVTQSNLFLAYTRSIPVNLLHGSISSSCLKSVRSDTHTDYPSFFHPLLSQTRLPVWGDLNFGYSELTWSDLTMERNDRNSLKFKKKNKKQNKKKELINREIILSTIGGFAITKWQPSSAISSHITVLHTVIQQFYTRMLCLLLLPRKPFFIFSKIKF